MNRRRVAEYHYTGKPCKRGHNGPRYSNGNCVECMLEREALKYSNSEYAETKRAIETARAKHKNAQKAIDLADSRNTARLARSSASREKRRTRGIEYRKIHGDILREYSREYSKEHFQRFKHRYAERNARRRIRQKEATPIWANLEQIIAVYALSRQITEDTGIQMSVDHIVPLHGMSKGVHVVCGLHTQDNLQVISLEDNKQKQAYLWPGQW